MNQSQRWFNLSSNQDQQTTELKIFEKHLKLDQKNGIDSKFSTDPNKFKKYVDNINLSFECMGEENFKREKFEGDNKRYRRSIFISKKVYKNDLITKENIANFKPLVL